MSLESIGNVLGHKGFASVATGTAGAVYGMTAIKAVARPIFIYNDKSAKDEKTKKYAATAEFLYQVICLGLTVAMIPFFKTGGLKFAEKYIKKDANAAKDVAEIVEKSNLFNRAKVFGEKYKEVKKGFVDHKPQTDYEKAMATANGGIEASSFIGSIIGLTMIAPPISHKIIKPIMHLIGMDKTDSKADDKNKVNVKA